MLLAMLPASAQKLSVNNPTVNCGRTGFNQPITATFELQNKVFVYRVEEGKTKQTEISVAPLDDGTSYIVESGLGEGDTIISEGAGLMREGLPVGH